MLVHPPAYFSTLSFKRMRELSTLPKGTTQGHQWPLEMTVEETSEPLRSRENLACHTRVLELFSRILIEQYS